MNDILLFTELLLDSLCLVLGIILIVKAKDNRFRLSWGIMVSVFGLIMLVDNTKWTMVHFAMIEQQNPVKVIDVMRMTKWLLLSNTFSLFPIASLLPGYFTPKRIIIFSLPVLSVLAVIICFDLFNGHYTPLYSTVDIIDNIHKLDVKYRVFILFATILIPVVYFIAPTIGKWAKIRRTVNKTMYIYVIYIFMIIFSFAYYTVNFSYLLFNTLGLFFILFCVFFSILFLYYENPLSARIKANRVYEIINEQTLAEILSIQIKAFMADKQPYTNPNYSIEELTKDMNAKQSLVSEAIKHVGFSGFKEYVNYLRIEYFKDIAKTERDTPIKELMLKSGFASKTTFYRIFNAYQDVTPVKYIEGLDKTLQNGL